jgi:hypothetical protein
MVCNTCGRWRRGAGSEPPEGVRGVCSCTEDQSALLKILSLLAACGVDPAAPPVLRQRQDPAERRFRFGPASTIL